MGYSIGIDIGTTTVKCILFRDGARVVAEAGKEYDTLLPKPSWAQQNPDDWWEAVVESIQTILSRSSVKPEAIKVISVSSQAPAVLPMSREGKPLYGALIWMDRRSTQECEIIKDKIGEKRVFEITGNRLDTYFTLTELMWFIRNHPEIMEKCYKVIQVNGYINYKFTGEFTIDETHATLTQIYDVHKRCWSKELLDTIGADESWMPRVCDCMEVIGNVTEEAAKITGLSTETVVLGGAVDATAAGLEMGVYADGRVAEMTGTSSVVLIGFDQLVTGEGLSYLRGRDKNSTLLYGAMNTAGGSLRWFRDALFGGETAIKDAYIRINQEIEKTARDPTRIIFLPYMAGERAPIWDPDARGTFLGLNLNTCRGEMLRSIMEGTSFALQDNLDQAIKMGIPIQDIICCGGCSKSDIWLRIKASVIKKEIKIPEVNLGAPGGLAYMNAAYMGEYKTPEEASDAFLKIKKIVEPVKEWISIYEELYQIYLESYQALKQQFKALAAVGRQSEERVLDG